MSKVKEFFTYPTFATGVDWQTVVNEHKCRFSGKLCYKTRKSDSSIAIGTCTVTHGKAVPQNVIICPNRLLEKGQVFVDCIHLLTSHIPGNELHVVSEVSIPGGSVDYFLVSTDSSRKVKDFVGIELQTVDTTGSAWPERQQLLSELNLSHEEIEDKPLGMNWKMTEKTILVQLHHKIATFEHLNKHLVLIVQDCLMEHMREDFDFNHVSDAKLGDSMHFHVYSLDKQEKNYKLVLKKRYSTDERGIEKLLGLKENANLEFDEIAGILERKISDETLFSPVSLV